MAGDGDGEPKEIAALRTNLTSITETVRVGNNLQWFAESLVERAFIPRRTAQGILGSNGVTSATKAGQLMDSVFSIIRTSEKKRYWFNEFVAVFSADRAYAELVGKLKRSVGDNEGDRQVSGQPILLQPVPAPAGPFPPATGPASSSPSSHQPPSATFWCMEKVKATIQELTNMFADLHAKVVIEMSKKEAENEDGLENLRSHLLLLPVRKATLHVKFFDAHEDKILEAKNTKKILAILCRYIDYRNYEILFQVVFHFCSKPLQERMDIFCELLNEFESATTVDVYKKAIPNEIDEEIISGFSEMVLKIDKSESKCTLFEIRNLNRAIIQKSTLCSHSVYIGAVSKSCVVVRMRFSSSAVGWVMAAMTPKLIAEHKIMAVVVDGSWLFSVQGYISV